MDAKKKYIKKFFCASSYDLKAVESFLEEMAAQGLMFVKQSNMFFYFEECEPKKVKFYIDVFDKASTFDTSPDPSTQEYIEYYKKCGWQYIFTNGKAQFFYTEDESVTPIQTDDEIRLKLIHKHVMTSSGMSWAIVGACMIMQLMCFISTHTIAEVFIKGWGILLTYGVYPLIIFPQVIRYLYFYIKNKRRLARGEALFFFDRKNVKWFQRIYGFMAGVIYVFLVSNICMQDMAMGVGLIILLIILIVFMYGFEHHRSGKNNSRRTNIVMDISAGIGVVYIIALMLVLIVIIRDDLSSGSKQISYYNEAERGYSTIDISQDEIPMTFETLGMTLEHQYSETRAELCQSLFGTYDSYEEYLYDENMRAVAYFEYDIIKSSFKFIMDSWEKDNKAHKDYTVEDITYAEASLWGAERVYAIKHDHGSIIGRSVIFEDWAVHIYSDQMQYTQENINKILECIKP